MSRDSIGTLIFIILYIIGLTLLLLSSKVSCKSFNYKLKADELSLEVRDYKALPNSTLRDPYMGVLSKDTQNEIRINHAVSYGNLFWKNTLHFRTVHDRVRHGGLEYYLGFKIGRFTIFKYHHSQHVMEAYHSKFDFPLNDAFGIRIDFIRRK